MGSTGFVTRAAFRWPAPSRLVPDAGPGPLSLPLELPSLQEERLFRGIKSLIKKKKSEGKN